MGRKILAIVTGWIIALAVIWMTYMIASMLAPTTPSNLEYVGRGDIAYYMTNYPPSAFAAVLIGYALAAFAGGFIATKMGRRWSSGPTLAIVLGGLLVVGKLIEVFVWPRWPQPAWLIVAGIALFILFPLVGYRLANKAV